MRSNPVKEALRAGRPAVGTWLSLGSITASRFLARAGFAWLTVGDFRTSFQRPLDKVTIQLRTYVSRYAQKGSSWPSASRPTA